MRYSDELIEEVIRRNDLVELIGESVRLKRRGSDYTGLCPFHSEKTPSFHVSGGKQLYYCFGCHAGGNAVTFLMEYHNYTFTEALEYLADKAGITLPKETLSAAQQQASERRAAMLAAYKKAAAFYYYRLNTQAGEKGLAYLRKRGLTDETLKRFGLGYADQFGSSLYHYLKKNGFDDDELLKDSGLFRFDEKNGISDSFWNRVMFPIQDTRGRVIGFGGRVMGDGKPKYLNSPETEIFNKRRNLYALNIARSTRRPYIILCEGYMDVISMHQAGFDNAVASLGTALTSEQCMLLRRFTGEVRLLYDSDGAGVNAALRAIPLLREAGLSVKVASLRPYKDPDELIAGAGADELEKRLSEAVNAFLFELDQLSLSYRRSDPGEWTAFQHEAAGRLLAVFPEELERQNYLEAVSGRFGFRKEALEKLIRQMARTGTAGRASEYSSVRRENASAALEGHSGSRRLSGTSGKPPGGGDTLTEELFLRFLAACPDAARTVKGLITAEDFRDPVCQVLAESLLSENSGGEAALIAHFSEAEDQKKAAGILGGVIPEYEAEERKRAFTDLVLGMLRKTNDERLASADIGDLAVYQKYIENRRRIEEIERGRIFDPGVPRAAPQRESG